MWTTKVLSRAAILLALTVAFQLTGLPQLVTGPVVNAMLILSAISAGPVVGVVIGVLTPIVALLRGIIPPAAQSVVPFIAIANAALVVVYSLGSKVNPWASVVLAAVLKFVVLSASVRYIVSLPPKVAAMMQSPQLLTAVSGGILALVVAAALKRIGALQDK